MNDTNLSFAAGHIPDLLRLEWNRFVVPINGFLMPLITIVTHSLSFLQALNPSGDGVSHMGSPSPFSTILCVHRPP